MTERGTFVINGSERIVVSQLHRSPGVFFGQSIHANGTKLYSARIIPFKGSWIEFATDINNVMYAYFGLAREVQATKEELTKNIGSKLAARVLKTWNEDFVDEDTGEVVYIERNQIVVDRETILDENNIDDIVDAGVSTILLHRDDVDLSDYTIIFNTLQKDVCNSEKEAVFYTYRQLRNSEPPDEATARDVIDKLFFSDKRYDLGEVGRYRLNRKLGLTTPSDVRPADQQQSRH